MISILLLGTLTTDISLEMVDLWIRRMITGPGVVSVSAFTGLEARRAGSRLAHSQKRAKSTEAESAASRSPVGT